MSSRARLLPGGEVEVINISASGALVEGKSLFVVGASVGFQTEGPGSQRLMGRITRCQVSTVHRDGTMTYQLALVFDESAPVERSRGADGEADSVKGTSAEAKVIDASVEAVTNQW